jgi:hypothetical protein
VPVAWDGLTSVLFIPAWARAAGNESDRLPDHGWWAGYSLCSARVEWFRVAVSPGREAITAAAASQPTAMMDSAASGTATTAVMPS